jgi:hypothetical protein
MPNITEHQSNEFTKLLLLGDAKSGKTTSLESLVAAGYKLRILDMDNLLDSFKVKVMRDSPAMAPNVEYITIRDKYKTGPLGPSLDGPATAFIKAMKLLDNWKYDGTDLGKPKEWGSDCILVIDSLSRLCDAAYDYHTSIAPVGKSGETHGQAIYGSAQDAVEMVLANLTSAAFRTNVIVVCHGVYMEMPDKTKKIFPQGVGQKLSPKIPQYFPVYIRYKFAASKRVIQVESDAMIDLAMPSLGGFEGKTLSVETGLAEIFSVLRGKPLAKAAAPTPKVAARR